MKNLKIKSRPKPKGSVKRVTVKEIKQCLEASYLKGCVKQGGDPVKMKIKLSTKYGQSQLGWMAAGVLKLIVNLREDK